MIFHGIFHSIVNTCASKWTPNGKLFVRPEKKMRVYDVQTRKNANPGQNQQNFLLKC